MKKILNFALVAAMLSAGATSCSNEEFEEGNFSSSDNTNKLTFVLPATNAGITYAIANDNEMALELNNTSIYMFDASNNLEAIITSIQPGTSGGKTTATIVKDENWDGNKKFVFVGNTTRGSSLPAAVPTTPLSLTDFQNILTDAHSDADHIATPLMLTSTTKDVNDVKNAPAVITGDVSLYRNVARFDIDNNVSVGNVEIKKVFVNDANLNGYVFGYQKGSIGGTTVGDLEFDVAASVLEDSSDPTSDKVQKEPSLFYIYPTEVKVDNSKTTLQLVGTVNGVDKIFSLRKVDNSGNPVDLTIEANKRYIISAVDDLTMTFTLVVADWDEGDSLKGEENPNGGAFGIATASGAGSFNGINAVKVPTAGGTVLLTVKATSAQGTDFVVADGGTGAPMVDVSAAFAGKVTQAAGGVVYSRPYYASEYTIEVPAFNANETSITKISIADKADITKTIDFYIYHEAEDGSVIPVHEATFPDAAFRNYVENTLGLSGNVTQAQFDAKTVVNVNSLAVKSLAGVEYFRKVEELRFRYTEVAEIDVTGFELLKTLDARDCKVSSIDISKNAKLEVIVTALSPVKEFIYDASVNLALKTIGLDGCLLETLEIKDLPVLDVLVVRSSDNMKSLKVTNCPLLRHIDMTKNFNTRDFIFSGIPNLKMFQATDAGLTSLDFSGYSDFEYISVARCNLTDFKINSSWASLTDLHLNDIYFTTLDVSGYPKLERLAIVDTKISSLDLSQNPAFLRLDARNTPISSLDFSNNPLLEGLNVGGTSISTLDLSHCDNTWVQMNLSNCPNLTTVYVWPGFNLTDPASNFSETYAANNTPGLSLQKK
ncbi:hypothetical protein [Bacteroides sp. 224]|uniref:hypothetical protein n=1 Tax=Bacteroides sp. 224 TaxID=2302936 RepID=UPI0013D6C31A|nr:hypothetical protein [Bacteroides sp. 224]NDV64247.1 hypothetical protein [Bacteroides sp. 224]